MNDFLDLKCEWEFSKIKDSYFQHLGVLKNAETSLNLAINFQMRFLILVHFDQKGPDADKPDLNLKNLCKRQSSAKTIYLGRASYSK